MNSYKLRKYLFNLLTLLFLGINTSWAEEYGACLLPFDALPKDVLKSIYGLDIPKTKGIIIDWQVTDPTGTGFRTSLENSISYLDEDPKFTEGPNQQLISFEGTYQRPGHDYAFDYRFKRFTSPLKATYDWVLSISSPYNKTKKEPKPKADEFTPILMRCRVDYQSPKQQREIFYSLAEMSEYDNAYLDNYLNKITDLRAAVINVPKSTSSEVSSETGGKSGTDKKENATMYYCGFNINNYADKISTRHYVSWFSLDSFAEMNLAGYRPSTITPLQAMKYTPEAAGVYEELKLKNSISKGMFTLRKPKQDMATIGDDYSSMESVIKLPKTLKKPVIDKREIWYVSGDSDGIYKDIKRVPAFCYKSRFFIDTSNLDVKNPTIEAVKPTVADSWPKDTEEKKGAG